MLCTSGSSGSRAGGAASSCGVSLTGFVRFGSSPALIAFNIRRAWYLAYFVFDVISGSSFFHTERTSRKVEAASRVSTVLLWPSQYFDCTSLMGHILGGFILGHVLVAFSKGL
jgi:hypothetical protein